MRIVIAILLGVATFACSGSSAAVDATDGCSAYYEPIGDDASVLYDPCNPRPTKPPRDAGAE